MKTHFAQLRTSVASLFFLCFFALWLVLAASPAPALELPPYDASGVWRFTVTGSADPRLDGIYEIEIYQQDFYLTARSINGTMWSGLVRGNSIAFNTAEIAGTNVIGFYLTQDSEIHMQGTARIYFAKCNELSGSVDGVRLSTNNAYYSLVLPIPHITTGASEWHDTLYVTNTSNDSNEATYTIQLYSNTQPGEVVYSKEYRLGPLASQQHKLKDLAPTATAGTILSRKRSLACSVGYLHAAGGRALVSLASITAGRLIINYPKDQGAWQALALFNNAADPVQVGIIAIINGKEVETHTTTLAPHQKLAAMLPDLFSLGSKAVDSVRITATRESIAAFGLTGQMDFTWMVLAPALPYSGTQP